MCLISGSVGVSAQSTGIQVYLDEKKLALETVSIEGSTFVPVRSFFELTGASVDWDSNRRTVTAAINDTLIVMKMGSSIIFTVTSEGISARNYPQPLKSLNSNTMIPLRAAGESIGGQVDWDGATRTIHITTNTENEPVFEGTSVSSGIENIQFFTGEAIIRIYDDEKSVNERLGQPNRIDAINEHFAWHVYNSNPGSFAMVGITEGRVAAIYSNAKDASLNNGLIGSSTNGFSTIGDGINPAIMLEVYNDALNGNKAQGLLLVRRGANLSADVGNEAVLKMLENQIIDISNAERFKAGLQPLVKDELLTKTAHQHASQMITSGNFNHVDAQGNTPVDRMEQIGFEALAYAGENIAAHYTNAYEVCLGWMNAQTYRANILNSNYTLTGVGVAASEDGSNLYFTVDFCTPDTKNNDQPVPE